MSGQTRLPWTSLVRPHGHTILCITTLSHRRFIDDAVQVVGLPFGARLVLRYRKRYVAPQLWEAIEANNPVEWHALIVLGADSNGTASYEPLRTGRLSKVLIAGEILTLEISLGGFAADGSYVWPQIASMAKSLPATFARDGDRNGHYLQALDQCPTNVIIDESVEAWERAADAFFQLDFDGCVPFLYLMQSDAVVFSRYRESGELVIESGSKLTWNVHTKCAPATGPIVNPIGEVIVEIACPPMRMVTSRRVRVDSRRDVRQMRLACDAVFRTVPGHLSIKVVVFQADSSKTTPATERNPISLSRYDIPVRAGRVLPTIASLAAAAAAATAMLDKSEWGDTWANIAAVAAGTLVFLSLKFGFRGSGS